MKRCLALVTCIWLTGCQDNAGEDVWNGWLEGESVAVSPPAAGTITRVWVRKGQLVHAGEPLYSVEAVTEDARYRESQARLARAQARLADLSKGSRPSELDAVAAQLRQAQEAESLSRREWQRRQTLVRQQFIAQQQADAARTAHRQDVARVEELLARLRTARAAARRDERAAAQADVDAARAQAQAAHWLLREKSVKARASGTVEDILYRAGEWIDAGRPGVLILPPENLKARFFIPQPFLGRVRIGQTLRMRCDGCGAAVEVRLSYLARQPEYTPPMIYSRENRAAMVFRAEADLPPRLASRLHAGQPIDILPPS